MSKHRKPSTVTKGTVASVAALTLVAGGTTGYALSEDDKPAPHGTPRINTVVPNHREPLIALARQHEAASLRAVSQQKDESTGTEEKSNKTASTKKAAPTRNKIRPMQASSKGEVSDIPAWVHAINFAGTTLGTPYQWGGTGPRYDCSGLVMRAFEKAGIKLPRVAADQYHASDRHPDRDELLPGDLVFYRNASEGIHHVGLYVGSGHMIHAPRTGRVVSFDHIDYMSGYYGATRVW